MSEIVDDFEKKAKFKDEDEADVIREQLEELVSNILVQVERRDARFHATLVQSGSVYEGVKVHQPDEFDFMIRINALNNGPLFHPCDKGDGHVKLTLNDDEWKEFKDEQGFFSPNRLSFYFKKLVNEALSDTEIPQGLSIKLADPNLIEGPWGAVYSNVLGDSSNEDSSSDVLYSETHGPATTLKIKWNGGGSYKNLEVSVDLTLILDYHISKLPIQLPRLPQSVQDCLQRSGFHVVPSGFDIWRISFSVAEKEILCSSPGGFKGCYRVLKIVRDITSARLGLDSALVPSYMIKTVLLTRLFTEGCRWEKEFWSQEINNTLKIMLQGMEKMEIQSFFIPQYNLLTKGDHDNRLRRYVLEDMLNQVGDLKIMHTLEEVEEAKQQIAVLQMIDVLEFVFTSSFIRNDPPVAIWSKMFINIGKAPDPGFFGYFWEQFTNLDSTDLDKNAYRTLISLWSLLEEFFKRLLSSLQGEVRVLAHKFYIRTCEKKQRFELKHQITTERTVEQASVHQFFYEEFVRHSVDRCDDENSYSYWSSIHKEISPTYRSTGVFQDVVDVTLAEGRDKGLAMFKQRLQQYLALFPEPCLMDLVVSYIGQMIYYGRDKMKRKLEYITISDHATELDLD